MSNFGGKYIRARGRSQWQIHALLVILFLALCFISTSHAEGLSEDLEPAVGLGGAPAGPTPRDPSFGKAGQQYPGAGQLPGLSGQNHAGFDLGGFGGRFQQAFVPTNLRELGLFLTNFDQAWYNQSGETTMTRIWRLSQEFVASSGAQTKVLADKLKAEIVGISKKDPGKIAVTDLPLALCMDSTKLRADQRVALRSAFEGTGVTVPDLIQRPQIKGENSPAETGAGADKDLAPIATGEGREVLKTSLGSPPRGPAEESYSGNGSPIRRPGRPKFGDQFDPYQWEMGCAGQPSFPSGQIPPTGLAGNGQNNAGDGNSGSSGDGGAGTPGGGPGPKPPFGLPGMGGGGGGGSPPGVSPMTVGGPQPYGQVVFAPAPPGVQVPPSTVKFDVDRTGIEATLSGIEQDAMFFRLTNLKQTAENGAKLFTLMSAAFPNAAGSPVNAAVLSAGMASINAMAASIQNSLKKGKDSSSSSSSSSE